MKRYSLWVKSLVFFLAVVTLLSVAVSALGILMAESMYMYAQDSYDQWLEDQQSQTAENLAYIVAHAYGSQLSDAPDWLLSEAGYPAELEKTAYAYELGAGDWFYTLQDEKGKVLWGSQPSDTDAYNTYVFEYMSVTYPVIVDRAPEEVTVPATVPGDAADPSVTEPTIAVYYDNTESYWDPYTNEEVFVQYRSQDGYRVTVGINRQNLSGYQYNGLSQETIKWLFAAKYPLIVIAAGCLLLFVVAFVFLMALAGKEPKTGQVNPRALNLLPLDLYLAAAVGITVLGCIGAYQLLDMLFGKNGYNVLVIVLLCGCGIGVATTDVGFFTALAAQFKVSGGLWWRHSICARILKLCGKVLSAIFRWLGRSARFLGKAADRFCRVVPVIWEWLLVGFVLALGLLITMIIAFETSFFLILLWWCCVGVIAIGYGGWCYGNIRKGIRRMKEGSLEEKIDTRYLFGSFKAIAEDLNALADVVALAAEKQMRSERMRAELITNVSHDIKTPLTSVINYVDLLQQPHTEEEGEQYLEVLSRQSLRLKKLVEDLMDMSKASSGNMAVQISRVDAVETVNQALGEFADKLNAAQLTPVFRTAQEPLYMQADGKLAWRVLSNLLSNAVKYALPGTRVYLDLQELDGAVALSVKNISREELNIRPEELTERFVRGDASRNTEGSGLGLNIAGNLMHLQKGSMDITVDGDLFKVTLTFPAG